VTIALFVFLVAFGYVIGVLSALLGVGGGIFMVPALVLVAGFEQQVAQATSLLVVLPTAVVATHRLQKTGIGDLRLSAKIGILGVVGSALGALLALQLSGEALRWAFAALLITVGVRLLADARKSRRAPQGPAD
jgi:uncharacterized membrane protein YfcA